MPDTSPTMPLKAYEGVYENNILGSIDIAMRENDLRITFRPDRHMSLTHWHYDTFGGVIEEYPHDRGSLVQFNMGTQKLKSVTIFGYNFAKKD